MVEGITRRGNDSNMYSCVMGFELGRSDSKHVYCFINYLALFFSIGTNVSVGQSNVLPE